MENRIIEFKQDWCDYLTPCPYIKGIEVGSYECQEECRFFKGAKNPVVDLSGTNYGKYLKIYKGKVECAFREIPSDV